MRIMRLFIFNQALAFTTREVASRAKVSQANTRRELNNLVKSGLIKKGSKTYSLNKNYRYLPAIGNFLIDAAPLSEKEIIRKISTAGSIKLILTTGVFVHNADARVDILVVGDHIKPNKLSAVMATIEAELGKELRYAVFETQDFQYRLGIYDKLIRDILDSRHEKILNRLGQEIGPLPPKVIHTI